MGTRLSIDSFTCLLSNEHDPSKVRVPACGWSKGQGSPAPLKGNPSRDGRWRLVACAQLCTCLPPGSPPTHTPHTAHSQQQPGPCPTSCRQAAAPSGPLPARAACLAIPSPCVPFRRCWPSPPASWCDTWWATATMWRRTSRTRKLRCALPRTTQTLTRDRGALSQAAAACAVRAWRLYIRHHTALVTLHCTILSPLLQVMKMMMTLMAPAAGAVRFVLPEGSTLLPGQLIAELELDDPAAVRR